MPHVDEGTLHALLDGALGAEDPARAATVEAHLEVCPDCRALLDDAIAIRNGATGVLAALGTDARPDFQEVLTRAGLAGSAGAATGSAGGPGPADPGRQDRLRRQARATRAVVWAATIVIALGTGYLVRDRLVQDRTAMDTASATASDRLGDRAEAGPRGADRRRETLPTGSAPETAPVVPERSVEARPQAETPRSRFEREPDAPTGPVGEPSDLAGAPAPPVLTESATRGETVGRRPGPAVTGILPGERPLALRAAAPPPATSSVALENVVVTGTRHEITPANARALMDGPVYVLPGAEAVRIEARGSGPGLEIRSVQRMDGGLELLVTQRPVEVVPPMAAYSEEATDLGVSGHPKPGTEPADAPEGGVVTILYHGYTLTVAGALPAEALRALAEAARPLADDNTSER